MVQHLSWNRLCAWWWRITRWRWRSWLILIKRNVNVVIADIVSILIVNIRIVDILVIWILIIGIYIIWWIVWLALVLIIIPNIIWIRWSLNNSYDSLGLLNRCNIYSFCILNDQRLIFLLHLNDYQFLKIYYDNIILILQPNLIIILNTLKYEQFFMI